MLPSLPWRTSWERLSTLNFFSFRRVSEVVVSLYLIKLELLHSAQHPWHRLSVVVVDRFWPEAVVYLLHTASVSYLPNASALLAHIARILASASSPEESVG